MDTVCRANSSSVGVIQVIAQYSMWLRVTSMLTLNGSFLLSDASTSVYYFPFFSPLPVLTSHHLKTDITIPTGGVVRQYGDLHVLVSAQSSGYNYTDGYLLF
jgi:hypothetical protein